MIKTKLLCLVLVLCLLLCGLALAEPGISNAGMARLLTQMYEKGLSKLEVGDAFGAYLITTREDGAIKVVYTLENGGEAITQEDYDTALAAFLDDSNAASDVVLIRPDENGMVTLPEGGATYALVLLNENEVFTISGNFQGQVICLNFGDVNTSPSPSDAVSPSGEPAATGTVSSTPTASNAPTASSTPAASNTPTATGTPTVSSAPEASSTPAASNAPVATNAPTATNTPAASNTPTATGTPTSCAQHNWDNGTVTAEATCTRDGTITYTCLICGATKTEALPAVGHDYNLVAAKEAGCETDGFRTYRCAVCGDTYDEILPAHGHSFNTMGICIYCGMGK